MKCEHSATLGDQPHVCDNNGTGPDQKSVLNIILDQTMLASCEERDESYRRVR